MARILWAAVLLLGLTAVDAPTFVTLLSSTGAPVAGARVQIQSANGTWFRERTDERGRFQIPGGVSPVRAVVVTPAGDRAEIPLHDGETVVRLAPTIITSVSVATGSAQTLHSLPLPASVLTEAQIRTSPAITSDAMLRALPGFDRNRSNSAFTNYGQLRVSFVGAGNDRGMVLVNGIPAQDGFGGQVNWAAYPAEDIARVELLRGSGSSLYGPTASGGVLDLRTFAPQRNTKEVHAEAALGIVALQRQAFSYATPLSNVAAASISLARHVRSYSDIPAAFASPVDHPARSYDAMESARLAYFPRAGISVVAGVRNEYDGQDQGRPNYWFDRHQLEYDAHLDMDGARTSTRIEGYARDARVVNIADRYPAQPGVLRYTQFVPTNEAGAGATWIAQTPSGALTLRADTRHIRGGVSQYDAAGAFSNGGSGVQNTSGLAAQQSFDWGRSQLLASARLDSVAFSNGEIFSGGSVTALSPNTTQAVSPRIAFRYNAGPVTAIRASTSGGYRAPFLNELVRSFVIGTVTYQANPNLQPERSMTNQLGIDVLLPRTHVSLDFSVTRVNNAIGFRTIDATHQQRANFERTRSTATIATFSRQLGRCVTVSGWATVQHAVVTAGPAANTGKRMAFVPDSAAYLSIDGDRAGLSLSYSGQTYADDLNLEPLGRALVAGLHAEIPAGTSARIRIEGDNLFGAVYRSSVDRLAPPAQLQVGLRFGSQMQQSCSR